MRAEKAEEGEKNKTLVAQNRMLICLGLTEALHPQAVYSLLTLPIPAESCSSSQLSPIRIPADCVQRGCMNTQSVWWDQVSAQSRREISSVSVPALVLGEERWRYSTVSSRVCEQYDIAEKEPDNEMRGEEEKKKIISWAFLCKRTLSFLHLVRVCHTVFHWDWPALVWIQSPEHTDTHKRWSVKTFRLLNWITVIISLYLLMRCSWKI